MDAPEESMRETGYVAADLERGPIGALVQRLAATLQSLLPHEIAFGALYAIVVARLLAAPGGLAWREIAIWVGFACVSLTVAWWSTEHPTTAAWRIRLGVYVVLMNAAYARMAPVAAALRSPLRDAMLQRVDRVLFGAPLPLVFDRWVTPARTEFLSACYFLLFPYILVSCVRQLWRYRTAPDEARRFFAGVFTVYGVGFVGYLLVPAAGPYLSMADAFAHPIAGGWITSLNDLVVRRGSNHVDVFPSLHVAVSAFLLGFDVRHARWRFWAYAVPGFGLWLSTLYLRYHYGIDVFSGFVLAAFGIAVAYSTEPRLLRTAPRPELALDTLPRKS